MKADGAVAKFVKHKHNKGEKRERFLEGMQRVRV